MTNTVTIKIQDAVKVNGSVSAFIQFPYDQDLVNAVRELPNRFWHAEAKTWEIPADKLSKLIPVMTKYTIDLTGSYSPVKDQILSFGSFKFKTNPFQHQIEGFKYGLTHDKFFLGDEQGLGKTKQVIDIAVAKKLERGYKHCLIICGVNGLKWNWQAEIKTHSTEKSHILGASVNSKGKVVIGSSADKLADLINTPDAYFLITNVETLRNDEINAEIKKLCDAGVISMIAVDEIHKCKNPTSQQGKAVLKLNAETKIAMTGTPLMNSPMDLYVVLKWLDFEKHSFFAYKKHYCVMGGYGGYEVVGYRNLAELRSNLEGLMLRRLKKEAMDLPEKFHSIEYVEMDATQRRIYREVKASIMEDVDKIKLNPNPLAQLIRLRQATGYTGILSSEVKVSAKLDRLEELVEEIAANGEKCIIFSNWTDMTHPTAERLARFNPAIITGETKDRVAEQDRFMKDPKCSVIIGTIGAMGTGLTLTAGSTVIFLDSPWNKANKEQAEDRAHRIGTTQNVNIITLVCKDTIDERIEELVEKKGAMSDMLVDGSINGSKADVLDFLLN